MSLPIKNVSAPEVIETAQFAVAEHNKKADSTLKFRSVVRGEYQVVAGMNYRLIIAAKDGGIAGKFEAVVYARPWAHYKRLTSFTKV
ncbi:hypothetical protein RHSIM_Rhsim02G0099800 [Rhododendron simsii]|uniref:Cystatin domain-containing protein n=1 Tax=Rhododendron simsii TaxID=118357 RepID=A0A834H9C3_RHOSS|nr:hypothetical protein RHSIM_Rhsim02G0099800 [Rhododendron simsii]